MLFSPPNQRLLAAARVQCDQIENYLALEYYRGELTTTRQILQVYSDYEKGEIDKEALLEIECSIKDGKNRFE